MFIATRRYEAAVWVKKMIGVVLARDLPTEPSEEEFGVALRSGLILCHLINKVNPGAVPKVVFLAILYLYFYNCCVII